MRRTVIGEKLVDEQRRCRVTELLEHTDDTSLRGSPAHAQVVRRWVTVVLMYTSAALGVLSTFGGSADFGSSPASDYVHKDPNNYISGSTQLFLIAIGVGVALMLVLPTIGLARRIRLRSTKASWPTIVLGGLVLVATAVGFFGFLLCGICMVIIGQPLSKFRPVP